jgi:DNA-directed RNA polymerase subunit omega
MARITVEDCLNNVNNRFTLIHMVAKRVRQLRKGAEPTIPSKNRDIVLSLREIAAGSITIQTEEEARLLSESKKDILPELVERTILEEEMI